MINLHADCSCVTGSNMIIRVTRLCILQLQNTCHENLLELYVEETKDVKNSLCCLWTKSVTTLCNFNSCLLIQLISLVWDNSHRLELGCPIPEEVQDACSWSSSCRHLVHSHDNDAKWLGDRTEPRNRNSVWPRDPGPSMMGGLYPWLSLSDIPVQRQL